MRNRRSEPAYQRMMKRVKVPENKDECWLWCGPVNNAGYGMIRGNDGYPKMTTVHRVAGIEKGLDAKYHEIQHTCLTKHCVNPDHLVEGNVKSRIQRLREKYNGYWQRPKKPYRKCQHCGGTSHVVWFSRMHNDCYPGMHSLLRKKKV